MMLHSYFKKIPSSMTPEEQEVMKMFMKEVYNQIRKQRPELTDTNHVVYIACPSNASIWTEKELSSYAEIALNADLPLVQINEKRIGLMRESRAAFIKACTKENTKVSIKEGILLIDFGSSTVDLTYYSSKHIDKPIDDGGECGASIVENVVFNYLKENEELIDKALSVNMYGKDAMLLQVRNAKEIFFTNDGEDLEISIGLTKITNGIITETINEFYPIEKIKELLTDYFKDIIRCFTNYRDKYLKNKPIKLVFLTGGASRMEFVKTIIEGIFDCKKEDIYVDTDPSLTISNGIALAGRADLRTYAMEQRLLNSEIIKNADIASLTISTVASDVANKMVSLVEKCYKDFASRSSDDSIESLESAIKKSLDTIIYSPYLNEAYKNNLTIVTNKKVIPDINEIVTDYFPDFNIPQISTDTEFNLDIDANKISTLSSIIATSVSKITEGFVEGMAKVLFNVTTCTIAFVTGIITDLAIEGINLFRNNKLESVDIENWVKNVTIDFRDKQTKLSSSKRVKVKKVFEQNKNNYRTNINEYIRGKLLSDEKLKTEINEKGRSEIKIYIIEQIDKARLILN